MRSNLIKYWIKEELADKKLIAAFKKIPREKFILKEYKKDAYSDIPLPILANQTISQPTTIMMMLKALNVKPGDKVLEIGAGSGYQAALLSCLVGKKGKVYTIEIIPELVKFAKNNLKKSNIKNVKVILEDGSKGLPKYKPYNEIIITAASPEIPKHLIKQLKQDGILVVPVGPLYNQQMFKITKKKNEIKIENLGEFIFVPLRGRFGWH